jgi:hypothetical protein
LAKDVLETCLKKKPGYGRHITVMKKEKHPTLVEAYKLTLFPTLLVLDGDGEEIGRLIGARNISMDIQGVLFALYSINE